MSEEILKELETSDFGTNKYYVEIIKEFINNFPKESTRVIIKQDYVYLKIKDLSGIKTINFTIENNCLKIKIDKTIDFMKYQDTIIYDDYGVMLERTHCKSKLKSDINEKFGENQEVLTHELNNLGTEHSIYTGSIFENIDYKKVTRPENFGLDGTYIHRYMQYDMNGQLNGNEIQGTFKVLNSNSISNLEIPEEKDVIVTQEKLLVDDNSYTYREPINFKK
ncbi:MAG: hypothetical protein IJ068_03215 [Bacilli bacterium]|nr:hypothetical protein [Bacilli bacterium]